MNHGAAMRPGPQAISGQVDVQAVPVMKYTALPVPRSISAPDLEAFSDTLTVLSEQGYAIGLADLERGYIVLQRVVGFKRLQVDTSSMILPVR